MLKTNCPAYLEPALAAARVRWANNYVGDHRALQASEVLQYASSRFASRSWDAVEHLAHAKLGAWLAEAAMSEEADRIKMDAMSAEAQAQVLGALTVSEIAMVLAARKAAQ